MTKRSFLMGMIVLILFLLPVVNGAAATIVVRARGTKGGEKLEVQTNGTTIASFTMTTSYANYSTSGSGTIRVAFTNDDQQSNGMDIQVDYITVDGTTYQAENQATNTGVYQNSQCGGSNSEWLHCNGYIQFNTGGTTTTAGSTTTTSSGGTTTSSGGTGSISIACGNSSAVGSFQADQYYSGGNTYRNSATVSTSGITNPPPAALFNNERYGAMSYTIPGFTAGNTYTVTLYFAETYLSSSGSRRFNVSINGNQVLSNFDIYATAGGQNKAIANSFTATANSSGQIVIQFTSVTENPKINGISVQPSGGTTTSIISTTTTSSGSSTTTTSSGSSTTTTSSGSSTTTTSSASTTTSSGSGNITVRARGTKGGEKLEVQVNGTTVASFTMTTSYANYSASGSGTIRVAFTNDDQQSNGMDIQVDYVIIDGTTYQAENQATNTGVYQNSQCGGSNSEWLHCNGYIEFGGGSTTTTSSGSTTTTSGGTTPEPSPTPGTGCNIPAMPSFSSLPSNSKFPDPFKFMSGSRMTSKNDWTCRRAEIAALVQEFELGYKPDKPTVTGSYSNNSITVNCSYNGKSTSFSCSISYPSSGSSPYPAMIGCGGSSLNNSQLSSLGVAVITFPNDQVAQQSDTSSRGKGKFYDLYGSSHSAGALIAWAWGVDCLIDALEQTSAARIDASRLGVTGCSRNGKGALICGAFCDRIKLTIPQESGAGGAASWRVSQAQKDSGQNVQTLSQIVTENVWFRQNFSQFGSSVNKLPFDHHMAAALCAPRALLFIENTQMEWLGNLSCWTNGNVTHMVWEALGISDKMGFSQVGHSDHCGFPSSQQPEVTAYVQKFLVGGGSGNTSVMKTDGSLNFDKAKWVDWTVPSLQ